jgi:hypothetical protein
MKPGSGALNRYYKVRFAILIAAIIYNLSESTFARMGPIWFTTLLMMVEYPSPRLALKKKLRAERPRQPREAEQALAMARS